MNIFETSSRNRAGSLATPGKHAATKTTPDGCGCSYGEAGPPRLKLGAESKGGPSDEYTLAGGARRRHPIRKGPGDRSYLRTFTEVALSATEPTMECARV